MRARLVRHCQFAIAVFHGFSCQLHLRLGGQDKTVAENLRAGEAFTRFFWRVFRRDGLPGTERDDANVPLALSLLTTYAAAP